MAKRPTQPKPKVDLFKVLGEINNGTSDYYTKLTSDEQKTLHPLVITRWMSGTSDPVQLLLLNSTSNRYNFALANHKPLLMDMLLLARRKGARYRWHPGTKKQTHSATLIKLFQQYYRCSRKEAEMYSKTVTDKDVLSEMARYLGWQDDEITKLKLK